MTPSGLEDARRVVDTLYAQAGIRTRWDVNTLPGGVMSARHETALLQDFHDPGMGLHDLAHYLVAPAWRRDIPNFGIGRAVHGEGTRPSRMVVAQEQADLDEYFASVLQIAILIEHLPGEVTQVAGCFGVPLNEKDELPESDGTLWLQGQGILDADHRPVPFQEVLTRRVRKPRAGS